MKFRHRKLILTLVVINAALWTFLSVLWLALGMRGYFLVCQAGIATSIAYALMLRPQSQALPVRVDIACDPQQTKNQAA
jgi:hypothetical protein